MPKADSSVCLSLLPPSDALAQPLPSWQLYGTLGCHLCETAEQILQQAQAVIGITCQKIDIAELPDAQMLTLADKIPVLVTPARTLYYPFSIMDILALA